LKAVGHLNEAIADYNRALELNNAFLSAYINRGTTYEKLGDMKDAKADFDRVLQIDPMNNAAIVNLLDVDRMTQSAPIHDTDPQ
jgi:tetratricopeptide (TPR) repeat protein